MVLQALQLTDSSMIQKLQKVTIAGFIVHVPYTDKGVVGTDLSGIVQQGFHGHSRSFTKSFRTRIIGSNPVPSGTLVSFGKRA